jgi:hypothetical protein
MPTNYNVTDETDLANAFAAIAAGGTGVTYTITLTSSVSLAAAESLDVPAGSSVTFLGDALFTTGQVFTVTGSVAVDLNYTGTITFDGGTLDNESTYFAGRIAGTPTGAEVINSGTIIYGGTGGAVDLTGGTNTVDNTGEIEATGSAGIGIFLAAGTIDNGSTSDTTALVSGGAFGVEITGAGLLDNFGTITASGASSAGAYLGSGTIVNGTTADTTATLSGYFGAEIAGSGLLDNYGTISGTSGGGAYLGSGTINNGTSSDTAALITTVSVNGIWIANGAGTINNFGTVTASSGVGVYLAEGGTLTNEGTAAQVNGYFEGVLVGQGGSTYTGTIDNYGTIDADGTGGGTYIGVYLRNGGTVVNGAAVGSAATIEGTSDGVRIDSYVSGSPALVENDGTIIGTVGVDFLGSSTVTASSGTLVNDGLIKSTASTSADAVVFGVGTEKLVLDAGGSFVGAVVGSSASGSSTTLEFANGTSGSLNGLSGESGTVTDTAGTFDFSAIGTLVFDAGSTWTVSAPGSFPQAYVYGNLDVASAVDFGSIFIESGGTATLEGTATSANAVEFVTDVVATLALAAPSAATPNAVSAQILDFGLDGTIDLLNVANSAVTGFNYQGNTLDVLGASGTLAALYVFGLPGGATFMHAEDTATTGTNITVMPCFATGTAIRTAAGDVAVERLRLGDRVVCAGGGVRPVVWIGRRLVNVARHPAPETVAPVRVRRDAFGDGLPRRDLLLSPDHAVYADGVLIPVKHLVDGRSIAQERVDEIEYWHVELDKHDVVFAEDLPVESYLDNGSRAAFSDQPGAMTLHPNFARNGDDHSLMWEALGYARLVVNGDELRRVRQRLALLTDRRAQASAPRASA